MGLPATATEEDIKRRYRELVMQVHPDVNDSPTAHEEFVKVQLAYEKLMGDHSDVEKLYAQYYARKYGRSRPTKQESEEEKRERMRERAREYARAHQKEAEEIERNVFNWLTRGFQWFLVRFFAGVSVAFGLMLLLDFWLPVDAKKFEIRNKVYYEFFQRNTLFITEGGTIDVPEMVYLKVGKKDDLSMEYSAMSHEFLGYRVNKNNGGQYFFPERFNFFTVYPLIPLLFLIPGILFFFKKNAVSFYLLYFASMVAYPGLLLHYFIKEKKLFYFLEFLSS